MICDNKEVNFQVSDGPVPSLWSSEPHVGKTSVQVTLNRYGRKYMRAPTPKISRFSGSQTEPEHEKEVNVQARAGRLNNYIGEKPQPLIWDIE